MSTTNAIPSFDTKFATYMMNESKTNTELKHMFNLTELTTRGSNVTDKLIELKTKNPSKFLRVYEDIEMELNCFNAIMVLVYRQSDTMRMLRFYRDALPENKDCSALFDKMVAIQADLNSIESKARLILERAENLLKVAK